MAVGLRPAGWAVTSALQAGPSHLPRRAAVRRCLTRPSAMHPPVCPQYEPELFPGLIYRMADPKIVLLIFVSGKVSREGKA